MKIIIINGVGESGKDSFVQFVKKYANFPVHNISTITPVKRFALLFGWDKKKDEKGRKLLSDLKMAWTAYNDGPFEMILTIIKNCKECWGDGGLCFVHTREPENIKKFQEHFGYIEVDTLMIWRSECPIPNNYGDKSVNDFEYDSVIENNGTLADLENKARLYLSYLEGGNDKGSIGTIR